MTLLQLRYMVTTTQCGSLSEAAKQLFITQPTLSASMKELEGELGVELFVRSSRGISLTGSGVEFLGYARQILEQVDLLEHRYRSNGKPPRQLCSISTQHYAFAVNAFVNMIQKSGADEYQFTLRETRTKDIIDDVANLHSEIGILYTSPFNEKIIRRFLSEQQLVFHPLFEVSPHVFISRNNPLAGAKCVTLADLEGYPCLSFEQGQYNSFYFSEEILSTVFHRKSILVSDRATLFNLLIGLNGYTISTGVLDSALNGDGIVSVPLASAEKICIGWITNPRTQLSHSAQSYIIELKNLIAEYGLTVLS